MAVVATAKKLEPNQIDGALALVRSWGLEVVEGKHLYAEHHQFAGTDAQRAEDLQWAIDDPEIKAVLFARGGYGTARIIDALDFTKFKAHPKWLCGFSDLTVLHSHVQRHLGIETLHSSMPIFFADGEPHDGSESLRRALFGEVNAIEWDAHSLNREGEAHGIVIGGNLAVLDSIVGTPSAMDWSGKILFIEDLTEYLYHLDRVMMQFKRSGAMASLGGLIVGQFTEMMDNSVPFGMDANEIIRDAVKDYKFPVAFNAPIGHVQINMAVRQGASSVLSVGANSTLSY